MADKDYRSQRDHRREEQKSGNPFGHLSSKYVRLQYAKAEAASKKTQHQGTESSKNH